MSISMKTLAASALGQHWSNIMVMIGEVRLWQCLGYVMVMLWLLCQPGERVLDGCCANQEGINVSAVPMAARLFCQPLPLHLAYPGFSGARSRVGR